ncbi:glycosyltransferase family 4 protein [Vibrio fluvialis]|uniref:glycosyltransferase family 4 protein n=1 Tax=Vibrio fluvialis TaxID=676 RepID=UPI000645AFAB|nr:glycosyltransferase family 4 protein [Vibrio fluvialis]
MSIVLVGPRASAQNYGGIVVLFENMITNAASINKYVGVIDSNSRNYNNKFVMLFTIIFKLIKWWKSHVALHGTELDFRIVGSILFLRKKLGGGGYSLRKFAGNYEEYFNNYNSFNRLMAEKMLANSSANFFETRQLVNLFKVYNSRTYWFPNVRSESKIRGIKYDSNTTFKVIFLSQVREDKGIVDLIEALGDIDGISLTIAGPIIDNAISPGLLPKNIKYVGEIPPSEIYKMMSNHHLLALPTFYSGEGYPGVIIEAFMIGLPILATTWRSIPELVGDAGILVTPNSPDEILKSVKSLRFGSHETYRIKSLDRANAFSDFNVTTDYWSILNNE